MGTLLIADIPSREETAQVMTRLGPIQAVRSTLGYVADLEEAQAERVLAEPNSTFRQADSEEVRVLKGGGLWPKGTKNLRTLEAAAALDSQTLSRFLADLLQEGEALPATRLGLLRKLAEVVGRSNAALSALKGLVGP